MREAGKRAVALAAAVAVAAAAGCGGGGGSRLSKADYEQKLKAEATQLQSAFLGINLRAGADLKALASKAGELQQKIETSAGDIEKLKPPQDAEADNHKIADALHTFAGLFGQIEKAAESKDAQKVQSLVLKLTAASQAGAAAAADLKKKGYDLGSFGG